MKSQNPDPYTMTQVLIELCCLSYSDDDANLFPTIQAQEAAISQAVTDGLAAAEMSNWSICWGPVLSDDIERTYMAFIATDGAGDYAVVIRGTDPDSALGWFNDAEAVLVAAPYGTNVNIAQGVLNDITVINGLQNSSSQTIVDFISGQVTVNNIYVTGHSFGGTQATAFAPWIPAQGVLGNVTVCAFAATSAGDAGFTALYDDNPALTATLFYNDLDVIPYIWVELEQIKGMYSNVNGPDCPGGVQGLIDLIVPLVSSYVDIANQWSLSGTLIAGLDWFQEVGAQHDHWLYASLLGAPVQSNDVLEFATAIASRKGAMRKSA